MIYTRSDLTVGTTFVNPYDKDQVLKVANTPLDEDWFFAWDKNYTEKWKIYYDEVKQIVRATKPSLKLEVYKGTKYAPDGDAKIELPNDTPKPVKTVGNYTRDPVQTKSEKDRREFTMMSPFVPKAQLKQWRRNGKEGQ